MHGPSWRTGSPSTSGQGRSRTPLPDYLERGGYDVHFSYGSGEAHWNGLRLVWEANGMYVLMGEFELSDSTTRIVDQLLGASLRTPYPPDLPQSEEP